MRVGSLRISYQVQDAADDEETGLSTECLPCSPALVCGMRKNTYVLNRFGGAHGCSHREIFKQRGVSQKPKH